MYHFHAPSRLHFGFLSLPVQDSDPAPTSETGIPPRRFGSVGLMIARPGLHLTARPAPDWKATGLLAHIVLDHARRLASHFPPVPTLEFNVLDSAPEHVGLGTGTQLALATASVIARAAGWNDVSILELARRVGRGARSGLGIHGFDKGGFLVDGGKGARSDIAPQIARVDFPEDWRVVVVLPPGEKGLHGLAEGQAFQQLLTFRTSPQMTDSLSRLILLGILPALAERDLDAFGEALYEFNHKVGEAFAPVQGGPYASPVVAELVQFIRDQGVKGAGQSSWGPAVFAVVANENRAADLVRKVRARFSVVSESILVTSGCNNGASVSRPPA